MCGPWCLRDMTRLGSGCSFSRLASTGCRLEPLPFEGFCFLLFEGFSFLLLEGFSSHAGAENGMPLEGFSFGRLASTEVLRQVGTHAAQGLPFCTASDGDSILLGRLGMPGRDACDCVGGSRPRMRRPLFRNEEKRTEGRWWWWMGSALLLLFWHKRSFVGYSVAVVVALALAHALALAAPVAVALVVTVVVTATAADATFFQTRTVAIGRGFGR